MEDDKYRVLFAKLDLRGPGFLDKFRLMVGVLSTLYVYSANLEHGAADYPHSLASPNQIHPPLSEERMYC